MKYAFSVNLPRPDEAQLAKKPGERWGLWHRINGRRWRPLNPYDKVMKERRMAGVQPGRAWGPPCLTNTLCARWTDGSRIQKKRRRSTQYKLPYIKDRGIGNSMNTKSNIQISSSRKLVTLQEPTLISFFQYATVIVISSYIIFNLDCWGNQPNYISS